jgi:hypothetical protein
MSVRPYTALLCFLAPAAILGIGILAPGTLGPEDEDPDLEERRREVRRWREDREAITVDLIAGRTTLAAAVAADLSLSGHHREYREALRAHDPGVSEDEAATRNLIRFALERYTGPDRAEVRRRLLAEYRATFPDSAPEIPRLPGDD